MKPIIQEPSYNVLYLTSSHIGENAHAYIRTCDVAEAHATAHINFCVMFSE